MNSFLVQILRFLPLGVVWLTLASAATPVTSMGNFTIDDNSTRFQYLPEASWTLKSTPFVQLDPSQVSGGTWHDVIGHPQDTSPREIHLNFTGVAVYVFCVIANQPPQAQAEKPFDTLAAYKFLIDGVVVGEFRHEAEDTTEYFYNTPVYVNASLPNKDHRFTILLDSIDQPVLMLFDYLVYSTMSPPSTTPSTSFPSPRTDGLTVVDNIFSAVTSIIDDVVSRIWNGVPPSAPTTSSATSSLPTSQYPASPTSTLPSPTTNTNSTSPTPTYITSSSEPSPSLGLGSDKNISTKTGKADESVAIVSGTLGAVVFFVLVTIAVLLARRTPATPFQVWRLWRRYRHLISLPLLNRSGVQPSNPEDPADPAKPIEPPPRNALPEVLVQQRGARLSVPSSSPLAPRDLAQSLALAVAASNSPAPPPIRNIDTSDQPPDYGLLDDPLPEYIP